MFGNDPAKKSVQSVIKTKEEDLIHQIQALIAERQNQKMDHLKALKEEFNSVYTLFPNGHVMDREILMKNPDLIQLEQISLSIKNALIHEENLAWNDL